MSGLFVFKKTIIANTVILNTVGTGNGSEVCFPPERIMSNIEHSSQCYRFTTRRSSPDHCSDIKRQGIGIEWIFIVPHGSKQEDTYRLW